MIEKCGGLISLLAAIGFAVVLVTIALILLVSVGELLVARRNRKAFRLVRERERTGRVEVRPGTAGTVRRPR